MFFYNVEADDLAVIIQLQLQDLENIEAHDKGKGRASDGDSDLLVAAEAFRKDLAAAAAVLSDRAMCRSMAQAVVTDADAIKECAAEGAAPVDSGASAALDDELLEKLRLLYIGADAGGSDETESVTSELPLAESSAWGASRKTKSSPRSPSAAAKSPPPPPQKQQRTCVCCGEDHAFTDVARSPCSHEYCRGCLGTLFEQALVDESLFPPRCCNKPIPLEQNRIFLPQGLAGRFQAKKIELETKNRIYCHDAACATFVPPPFVDNATKVARCVRCNKKTCTTCKQAAHTGDCPSDPALLQVMALAAEQGWQRCYSCQRIVELGGLLIVVGLGLAQNQRVAAARSSATSAARTGRAANAGIGMSRGSWAVRPPLSTEIRAPEDWETSSERIWCREQCKT